MSGKVFAAIFAGIFLLGALPLLMAQSIGAAGAGITAGLMEPLSHFWHIVLCGGLGIFAASMGGRAMLLVPGAFLLMLCIGLLLDMPALPLPVSKSLILLAILCFGVTAHYMTLQRFIVSSVTTSAIAFLIGGAFAHIMPTIASPLHFMVGAVLATVFLLGAGVCIGFTAQEMLSQWAEENGDHPWTLKVQEWRQSSWARWL